VGIGLERKRPACTRINSGARSASETLALQSDAGLASSNLRSYRVFDIIARMIYKHFIPPGFIRIEEFLLNDEHKDSSRNTR
jgi:hypothetical protein